MAFDAFAKIRVSLAKGERGHMRRTGSCRSLLHPFCPGCLLPDSSDRPCSFWVAQSYSVRLRVALPRWFGGQSRRLLLAVALAVNHGGPKCPTDMIPSRRVVQKRSEVPRGRPPGPEGKGFVSGALRNASVPCLAQTLCQPLPEWLQQELSLTSNWVLCWDNLCITWAETAQGQRCKEVRSQKQHLSKGSVSSPAFQGLCLGVADPA